VSFHGDLMVPSCLTSVKCSPSVCFATCSRTKPLGISGLGFLQAGRYSTNSVDLTSYFLFISGLIPGGRVIDCSVVYANCPPEVSSHTHPWCVIGFFDIFLLTRCGCDGGFNLSECCIYRMEQ